MLEERHSEYGVFRSSCHSQVGATIRMPSTNPEAAPIIASLPCQFLFWMVVVFVVKWPALAEPPVWDAAFGLFPAAGELSDNGFDLPALLQLPTYREGGPNCHAESVVTWITAGVLYACGKGPTAIAVLHLLHFAATAWTLAVLFRVAVACLGQREAWLICVALLACPLFSVQAGAMYFEMPLAACAVSSLVAYANGQLRRAIAWSVLAVLVKQSGVIVPGALIAAVILRIETWPKRLALAAAISVPAFAVAVTPLLGTRLLESVSKPPAFGDWWTFMSHQHLPYLRAIPDISLACVAYLACGLLLGQRVWKSLRYAATSASSRPGDSDVDPDCPSHEPANNPFTRSKTHPSRGSLLFSVGVLQMCAFAGFFFVVPYIGRLEFFCLPRYFVFLLPLLFFGLAHAAATVSRPLASVGLVLVTTWFVLNRDGAWYPAMQPNNGAIAERSESYRRLTENQQHIVNAAARLPANSLLLYGLPEHYFFSYPWMGYAKRPHPGGRCVTILDERPSLKITDLPDRFYVILDAVVLGGRDLRGILREAGDDPSRRVVLIDESGRPPFSVRLYEVSRIPEQQTSSRN